MLDGNLKGRLSLRCQDRSAVGADRQIYWLAIPTSDASQTCAVIEKPIVSKIHISPYGGGSGVTSLRCGNLGPHGEYTASIPAQDAEYLLKPDLILFPVGDSFYIKLPS